MSPILQIIAVLVLGSLAAAQVPPGTRVPADLESAGRRPMVEVVYLLPKDRTATNALADKVTVLMTLLQDVYRRDLAENGFATEGLGFEAERNKVLVHVVPGGHETAWYNGRPDYAHNQQWTRIVNEVEAARGGASDHLFVVFAETYDDGPAEFEYPGGIALGARYSATGGIGIFSAWILRDEFCATTVRGQMEKLFDSTLIPGRKALGGPGPESPRFEFIEDGFGAVMHELGHALGLPHDRRDDGFDVMGNGFRNLQRAYAPGTGRVGFSIENARLLAATRFLSKAPVLDDRQAPTVQAVLDPVLAGATKLHVTGEAKDETGLRALACFNPAQDSVVGGAALNGRRSKLDLMLDVKPVATGPFTLELLVADGGGNVTKLVLETVVR